MRLNYTVRCTVGSRCVVQQYICRLKFLNDEVYCDQKHFLLHLITVFIIFRLKSKKKCSNIVSFLFCLLYDPNFIFFLLKHCTLKDLPKGNCQKSHNILGKVTIKTRFFSFNRKVPII